MSEKKSRRREHITEAREAQIIILIDEWDNEKTPLSQEALVRRIKCKMGLCFSRQGLMKRTAIKDAFLRREKEIKGSRGTKVEKEPIIEKLDRQIENLKRDVAERDKIINNYEEMFVTYRYNARQLGIPREQLEAPIPPRNQSEGSRG